MRKRYSIQEVFRRILVVFSAILNVLQSCEVFANFCANYFAKKFFVAKKIFIGIQLALHFQPFIIIFFSIFFINVRKCVQKCVSIFCEICAKLFLQIIWHGFILQCYPFLFTSFSCYCGIILPIPDIFKIYFLKGIVELERYEAWNLALQINDVTLSNVVTRRSAEPRIQWSHFLFRLQLISNSSLMRDL